jgi:DNA sulfur modification protein DndD
MKINRISLFNFKSYAGLHEIDLSVNNEKNVVLLVGSNGSGKTTILEAVKLCLYGRKVNGKIFSDREYEIFLKSFLNKNAQKRKRNNYYVELELEIEDFIQKFVINIRRSWETDLDGTLTEDFTLTRDGKYLEIIPKESWEDYIQSIFPPYIMEYFFFNGEKIKLLSIGDKAEKRMKESIRSLTGLQIYETLSLDLNNLIRKIKINSIKAPELRAEIELNEKIIEDNESKIIKLNSAIDKKENLAIELKQKKEEIEKTLRQKAGAFADEKDGYDRKLSVLDEEYKRLTTELSDYCEYFLPFIIADKLCKKLEKQLSKEKQMKELIFSETVLKKTNTKILKELEPGNTSLNLSEDARDSIKNTINNIFSEILSEINSNENILHDLNNDEMSKIEFFLNSLNSKEKEKLGEILQRRESALIESKKIKDKLKQISTESILNEYISTLSSVQTEINILEKEIESHKAEIQISNEVVDKSELKIRNLEEKIVYADKDNHKIITCERITNTIDEFIEKVIKSKIKELEQTITELYHELANKEDMVKKINIDKDSLTIDLIGYDDEILDKTHISSGEKEIYTLSLLWGLSKISKKQLPVIVDSLLSRLDNTHAENIVEKFFPTAGNQVIILAHDREIGQDLYDKLSKHIAREYKINPESTNKITEGYQGEVYAK